MVFTPVDRTEIHGSKYYDIAVDDWAAGKYYKLWYMKKEDVQSDKIKHTMKFNRL